MAKVSGEMYCKVRLCVDSYENGVMSGQYVHPGREECKPFHSLVQFFIEMETMMDGANFPQSYTAKRTFKALPDFPAEDQTTSDLSRTGARATFEIRLLFRQHASWQGTVLWVEGQGEQSFRSVLELILLMDSALKSSA